MYNLVYGKNSFAEVSRNLAVGINLKITLFGSLNNYGRMFKPMARMLKLFAALSSTLKRFT